MTSYVPVDLRRLVESRANGLCEYCLIHDADTYLGCQVDHVVAEKHGGQTISNNLCLACTYCNRSKGTDLGSLDDTGDLVRFYNPRADRWLDHFRIDHYLIVPTTPIGIVTARILGFDQIDRVTERIALHKIDRYPTNVALAHINSHIG